MERKKEGLKNKMYCKWFFGLTFFTGTTLMVFQIDIYRRTIIDPAIPLTIIIVFGVVAHLARVAQL
ncbi:hypothetical protein HUW51_08890 [Adhaeribacter swui]|uniref:Uncharacterized protein n=1 Tax=Adhaeribacter swui TaxID=2086471 RepID=A0A7G7G6Q8_9BACT|nr:hypothetical protein [Adhaeribacter swui]QNF32842.1 hypothetical protein HUW51_08890 [Adhaeribacter swui]